ncbi:MAG: TIGR00282 family metallophosphoesterase [Verrucomicrobiales bacterium]|nr:TIGR00282 family metallophosphoesterase [Verrucomicrobiales bacterium]
MSLHNHARPDENVIRIGFFGDVVGEPGRKAVAQLLPEFKRERGIDFYIVNGENSAGGRGITPKISIGFLRAGAAVVTTGDHIWDQPEIVEYIQNEPRLLRPMNFPEGVPGQGSVVLPTEKCKVGVINVLGRTFTNPVLDNPFNVIDREVERMRQEATVIFVDFHAETTSEKIAMGRMLDGRVSAVVGTHTHVQTADEQIFPGGTAFLCDAGMCGPTESILGRRIDPIIYRFRTNMPARFPVAKGAVRACGVIVDIEMETGKAVGIERISTRIEI